VWWLFIDHQGRRKARRARDRQAAELAAIEIRARLAEGDATVLMPTSSVPTFAEYARRWLAEAIEEACRQLDAIQPQPDPVSKKDASQ
jgi:integrase